MNNKKNSIDLQSLSTDGERHIADPQVADALAGLLNESNPWLRQAVVGALEELGEAAVETLIVALSDSDAGVRRRVVDALGRLKDERVEEPLAHALSDENPGVRKSAADALGRRQGGRAIEPMVSIDHAAKPDFRRTANDTDGPIKTKTTTERPALASDDKIEMAGRLESVHAQPVQDVEITEHKIAPHNGRTDNNQTPGDTDTQFEDIKTAERPAIASDAKTRFAGRLESVKARTIWVAEALESRIAPNSGRRDNNQTADDIDTHVENIKTTDRPAIASDAENRLAGRLESVKALTIRIADALEPKIAPTSDRIDDNQKESVTEGPIRGTQMVQPTITIRHSDPQMRAAAAKRFGQLGDPRAVDPLIDLLGDSDALVRQAANKALAELGDPAVESLITAARAGNLLVQRQAIHLLADHKNVLQEEPFIFALVKDDEIMSADAIRALKRIGTPTALAAIQQHEARPQRLARIKATIKRLLSPVVTRVLRQPSS